MKPKMVDKALLPLTAAPAPGPTSTAPTSITPTTPRTAPGPGRCHTADLGAELREPQPITLAWSSSEVCSHGRIGQTSSVAGTRID